MSFPTKLKLSTNKNAKIATHNYPKTAEGSKSRSFADLTNTALTARPVAVTKPIKSPKKLSS